MIAPDRDRTARRRIDEQDRRRLPRGDRVEKVKLEAEQVVASNSGREDYVEVGHQKSIAGTVWEPPTPPSPAPYSQSRLGLPAATLCAVRGSRRAEFRMN